LVFLFEEGKSDYIIEVEDDAVLVDQVVLEPWARVNLEKSLVNKYEASLFKGKSGKRK